MKQIELKVTRYYTKSVSTTITYPKGLDKNEIQEFLNENTELKKSINKKFENADLYLDEENCDYTIEKIENIGYGQVVYFDSWNIIE